MRLRSYEHEQLELLKCPVGTWKCRTGFALKKSFRRLERIASNLHHYSNGRLVSEELAGWNSDFEIR